MDLVLAALLGFAGGVVGGMLGVGGGILFVPALAIVLDEIVGAWRQHAYGNVRWREGLLIGVLSPLGVVGGVVLANAVSQRVLEVSFALLLLVVAAQLVLRGVAEPGRR